ncbi:MAG: hypothetical protein QXF82_10105 [Nitrososphaeria archaeon]
MSEEGITSKILKLLESEEKSAADREAKLKVIQVLLEYINPKRSESYREGYKEGFKDGYQEGWAEAKLTE